jgi:hypothetical protein
MAQLKAGSVTDIADSMTAMIEQAMHEEWARAYPDDSLPGELGRKDRLVLFAAVAKGVLRYLHKHQLFIATTRVHDQSAGHVHQLAFDLIENLGPPLEPGP